MFDLIFIHLQKFIFQVDRVAISALGAGARIFSESGGRQGVFGAAALNRGLEPLRKIFGDVHALVAGGFDVSDIGSEGLLPEDAGIQGPLRNAHVKAGLDSLDHANPLAAVVPAHILITYILLNK